MKVAIITVATVLALLVAVLFNVNTAGNDYTVIASHDTGGFTKAGLLDGVNKYRTDNGLDVLTASKRLDTSAQLKANDMQDNGYFAHVSPKGVTPWVWFEQSGYNYTVAGENLAKCYTKDSEALEAWWNSPKHKDNILGNYTEAGFGFGTYADGCIIIVEHFGKIE